MAQLQITIDDGPQPVASALDLILAEIAVRGVKAAFFVIGQEVAADPSATRKIHNQGHILGNHSQNHLEPTTANYTNAQIKEQFKLAHDAVTAAVNVTMKHWRAPRLQEIARVQTALTAGPNPLYTLSHCDENADSKDTEANATAATMLAKIRQRIADQPNRTWFRLLFHVLPNTATALPTVLTGLANDGHTYVDFSQAT